MQAESIQISNSDSDCPVEIKYTARRGSIGFKLTSAGLRILAPKGTSNRVIQQALAEKQTWVDRSWQDVLRKQTQNTSDNPTLFYKGIGFPVSFCAARHPGVTLESGQFCVDFKADIRPEGQRSESAQQSTQQSTAQPTKQPTKQPVGLEQCRSLLEDWYSEEAAGFLPARLQHWSEVMATDYSQLKIRHYKSRWGSCDSRGRITLNARLMMMPDKVIDYVVIHELSHRHHLNHSPAFWQLVARFCPDYQDHRRWINQHRSALNLL